MNAQAPSSYVEYGSRVSAPVPVECIGGHLLGLVLKGEKPKIEELCKRVFNASAAGTVEYMPLSPYVLLLVGSFASISSRAQKYLSWGSVAEAQLSLWVPLARGHEKGNVFTPEYPCLAAPYMFVDNPLSYEGGREDYGYSKAMGQFTPTNGLGDLVTIDAFAGVGTEDRAEWTKLFELTRVLPQAPAAAGPAPADAAAADTTAWRTDIVNEIVPHYNQFSPDAAKIPPLDFGFTIADFIAALLNNEARQVFLKQFRDANVPGGACYQAIVEAMVHASNVSWRPSLKEWQVKIEQLVSHPVAAELGVSDQSTSISFELQMDMEIAPGTVVRKIA